MLHQLGSVRTVLAAWEDLVAAVVDNSTPNRQIALRVAQLAEMIELHGRSWDSSITYALSEHAAKNQLAEAEDLLRRPPFLGAEIVWLAFGNAHLRQGYQRLGAIQFFDMRFSLADLRNGSAELDAFDDFEKAPELTDELVHKMFFEVHAEAHVLARVELTGPHGLPAPLDRPIRRARQLAHSVVEAAGFLNGGSQWELLEGGAAFGGGKYMGTLNFRDPSELARRAATTHPTHELTGFGLTQLPAAFGSAIRREDPTALRATTELDWHQQTSRIPSTAMRVAQRIRVFETQWVAGGSGQFGSWEEHVRHYLRDQWCWHEIHDALFAGVASIEHPGHPNYLTDGQRSADVLTAAFRQIMELRSGVTARIPGSQGRCCSMPARSPPSSCLGQSPDGAGASWIGSAAPEFRRLRGSTSAGTRSMRCSTARCASATRSCTAGRPSRWSSTQSSRSLISSAAGWSAVGSTPPPAASLSSSPWSRAERYCATGSTVSIARNPASPSGPPNHDPRDCGCRTPAE